MLTLDRVYQASHVLKNVVRKTDYIYAPNLSNGCDLYLKAENLQVTGSFKVRGSYFKMSALTPDEKTRGVVACSAGNHAQGVALSAKANGIKATIFLPNTAPISKIEATRAYGAEIVLIDGVYDDAYAASLEYQKGSGAVFIHPFNDIDVIAGQGTIGLELLEQGPDLDAIVLPVGGGGLAAGVAFTVKKLNPDCKVYGVQSAGASSMQKSMDEDGIRSLPHISTFADGIAVKSPGDVTFALCSEYLDEVVTVSDDEIATAILSLMEQEKLVSEGAGAAAVAAVMFKKLPLQGEKVCALVSGGNIDVNILSRVIHRGLLTSGRLTDLTIELLDKPGQLRQVASIIADMGANVIKVNHNPAGENADINSCFIEVSMETRDLQHLVDIKQALTEAGYRPTDHR